MKDFVSFVTDLQSMYFIPTKLLEENINGVRFPQFQHAYIHYKNHPSHKICFSCVVNYIICGGEINIWNYRSGSIS